jgi:hypothetical protein
MWIDDEFVAVAMVWLLLTGVVVAWTVRIALLLHRQRRAEVVYRLQLAAMRGAALRAMEQESKANAAEPR